MPAGPRVRANNVYGTIENNPLAIDATSFTSGGLNLLPPISGQHAVIVIDPKRTVGPPEYPLGHPEIVVVTQHLPTGTTATILRGQYGTVAREWPEGTPWAHVPIDEDYIEILTGATRPADPYEGQLIYETDTDRHMVYNGSVWLPMGTVPRMGWHVTRVANQGIIPDTVTPISWDTEIQDTPNNFTPGAVAATTFVVPAGGDGLWAMNFQIDGQGAGASMGYMRLEIAAGGMSFLHNDMDDVANPITNPSWSISPVVPLLAGATILCGVTHTSTTNPYNVRGRFMAYRIGN